MSDLLQVSDLERAKLHDTFHSEVITGKAGGLSTGANIDYATNAVTGQVQKTLPATIDGLDWSYVGKFADGVTFTKKTDFALDSVGTQWIYTGSLPFTATAGTVPSEPTYQAVHVKSASAISNANGGNVQDFIDEVETISESEKIDVFKYLNNAERNAVTSGNYGPIISISTAIDAALADVGSGIYPVNTKTLWFANGAWIIDKPIRSKIPLVIDGDNARIIASTAFIGSTLNGPSGPIVLKSMIIIIPDDNYDTITGPVIQGAKVTDNITLHGSDVVDHGLYSERVVYASYNARVDYAATPISIGPSSWGLNLDNIVLENFDVNGVHFKTNSAANGCSISNPKIWGRFKNPLSGLFFDVDAECNGVIVTGGFIEKLSYAALHNVGSGTCHYNAVDMEQCVNTCVRVIGNDPNSVPVVISGGSFLDSPTYRVYAGNCTVQVENSRLYGVNGGLDFATNSTGKVLAKNNKYHLSLYTFETGSRVIYDDSVGVSDDRISILPSSLNSLVNVGNLSHRNNGASPNLNTTSITRLHNQLNTTDSESVIDIYATSITSGIADRIAGLRCSTADGLNTVYPLYDNVTSLGLPSSRFSVVYSAAGVQTTSDARYKSEIRELIEVEKLVAKKCASLVRAYKLDKSEKISFGVIAQDIVAAFESEGLIAEDYSVVEHILYDESDIYSVCYDQLLCFIITSLR